MINLPLMAQDARLVPSYAHASDAAMDLRSAEDVVIPPLGRALVHCGISFAIPKGYAGLVIPRSGLAAKHGVTVLNGPGLIDSGYRGEVCVSLVNLDKDEAFSVAAGDRIAQLMLVAAPEVNIVLVDSLEDSDRGLGGFGSSGIK